MWYSCVNFQLHFCSLNVNPPIDLGKKKENIKTFGNMFSLSISIEDKAMRGNMYLSIKKMKSKLLDKL